MLPRTTLPNAGGQEMDRVRASTDPEINHRIDEKTERDLRYFSIQSGDVISDRIQDLDNEWDMDRLLQCNAACFALTGVVLGTFNKKWLILSATVLSFLAWHANKGWCPPIPILRRLGFRTRREIDAERFSLKFARGDFDEVREVLEKTEKAIQAFKACQR